MPTKEQLMGSFRGQLLSSNLDMALSNLADVTIKVEEQAARIKELEAENAKLKADMDAAPAIPAPADHA